MPEDVIVAVLAGGRSRRMGGLDKAAIVVDGCTMLQKVWKAADDAGLSVIIMGRSAANLPPDMHANIEATPDDGEPRGPLGGLATALRVGAGANVILCGCDMPRVTAECFSWLVKESLATESRGVQAVIPQINGRAQPLFGWYSCELLPAVLQQLEEQQFAMHQLLSRLNVRFIEVPLHLASAVQDVDTVEQLQQLHNTGGAGLQ